MHRSYKLVAACSLACSSSLAVSSAIADIEFNDVSAAAGLGRQGETYGASWGDLNGDAYPDLFVSNHRTQPSLYLNRGDGSFLNTAKQVRAWLNRPNADTHGASWVDFDGDGDQDLMVTLGRGNPSQFLVNERGALIDRATSVGLNFTNWGGRLPIWQDWNGDRQPDFVIAQMGGVGKAMRQNNGVFVDETTTVKLNCKPFQYGQLLDLNGDGRLDLMCADDAAFPQRIYNTLPVPWANLTSALPPVANVVDTIIADFNNDGRQDIFYLSGTQLRPSSVVQDGANKIEALLLAGEKGFNFTSDGAVTVDLHWNKLDNNYGLPKIYIGAGGKHPSAVPFTLNPADPAVAGMPVDTGETPILRIGFDQATKRWTFIMRSVVDENETIWSDAYFLVSSTAPVGDLRSTGLWGSDYASPPTLLMNYSGGFQNQTAAAGLTTSIQCASASAGDYDNDMDVDLYLACRNGVSNLENVLYENQGDGTFLTVPGAGGAAGPVGAAVGSGAGTSDSVVTADYDVDGFLDLFVTNGFNMRPKLTGGREKLFRNAGNANNWIELILVGTVAEREAVGARVTAIANGVSQMREVNGGYHRWSQENVPLHFGLAGAGSVDLSVQWPNGVIETHAGVPANGLYRLTENGGITAVTPGDALPYPCGTPTYAPASDAGIFVWKDCATGVWQLRASPGGVLMTYSGSIISSDGFSSVVKKSVETNDTFDNVTDPRTIDFAFKVNRGAWDGVSFTPRQATGTCLSIDAPAQVFFGPLRVPVPSQFDLETLGPCAGQLPKITASDASTPETGGQAEFTIGLSMPSAAMVQVDVDTADGTAAAGQDYTRTGPRTLSFAPGGNEPAGPGASISNSNAPMCARVLRRWNVL